MKKRVKARGYRAMAEIMAELPATVQQITAKLGCLRCTVCVYLNTMRTLGLVHRRAIDMSTRGRAVIWDAGRGDEVAHPLSVDRPSKFVLAATQYSIGTKILAEPTTVSTLAAEMGIARPSAAGLLKALREAGLVRIAGWEPAGNTWAPQWQMGKGVSARRPPRMPRQVQNARYRERAKARQALDSVNDAFFSKAA